MCSNIETRIVERSGKGCWTVTLPYKVSVGDTIRVRAYDYTVKIVQVEIDDTMIRHPYITAIVQKVD